ncbi:MAG: glycogen/starch/alpha-glucan phosphorylase [Planctomycetia bacterium]|nr:glycogen/starch/alpha-glucan phosphorylase [Planctomycetia bacterium]
MAIKTSPSAIWKASVWGTSAPGLKQAILHHLHFTLAKDEHSATRRDYYEALVHALRDRLIQNWLHTQQRYYDAGVKRVYYLSAEFLIGRLLDSTLINLDLHDACRQALQELGQELEPIIELEWDAGLGTGGLGRLAACFLDSMATLGLPAYGYGIRYEFGIFYQKIVNGYQVETADNWLRFGNPWEMPRPEDLFTVQLGGRIQERRDAGGRQCFDWVDTETVMAMAYDLPIPGYGNGVVNTFRVWGAKASREFDLAHFNQGDYIRAVEEKNRTENISRVLYPRDDLSGGRELRLRQEYFLVSASLQDIVRRYRKTHAGFECFPDKVAIQLNDTHPVLAIPELMRLLLDEARLGWEQAWGVCQRTFGYTNHTVLPEALELWPVDLLACVLPRHLQIIYEINRRFLGDVAAQFPGDPKRLRRLSLIEEDGVKSVRMAHLALVGSHAVNGVSALHTNLLRREVFRDFHALFPERFTNKTNGITPRLWLKKANPALASLITRWIGPGWVRDLDQLRLLEPHADNAGFRAEWRQVKHQNKIRLAEFLRTHHGIEVEVESLFDVQVKRIHEYKRQLLNLLHVVALYQRLQAGRTAGFVSRTCLFAGKAAPGYAAAKLIVKLITAVGEVVNRDPGTNRLLQVHFLPNYSVSLGQQVIPAADLSEQISTAGTEASGTGNMKLALNGALTIGTLDGANVEIREAVGPENFFLFGLRAEEIRELRRQGYDPWRYYDNLLELRQAFAAIREGRFSPEDPALFRALLDELLLGGDPFMLMADFASYLECQERVNALYRDPEAWTRRSILNVARMGYFSSDRTIREYATDVWEVKP